MAVLTLEEYKKRKKEGTLNDNSNTNNVSTVNGNRILTLDEFKNTSQYKSIQDRITQKTSGSTKLSTKKQSNNKWKNSLNDGYDFGDITKTVLGTAGEIIPRVAKNTFEAGKEVVKHPIQSTKTLGVGISSGVDKADDALNNATSDFFNWLLKKKKDNKPSLSLKEYNRLIENGTKEEKQQVLENFKNAYGEDSEQYKFYAKMFNIKDTRSKTIKTLDEIVNPKYYNTDTYKKFQNNQLSEEQQKVWNVGENIGNMLPSMAVSTVNPAAGSAMFYVQTQQNYTEEAKQRGYNDKDARIYGLIMGGVETGIERLGFDQLGGLGKLSEGSIFKAMGGEALEEFATPYVDHTIRTAFGEKLELSDTVEESITSAVYGAVVGGIMNMGGKGIVAVDNVVNKINNNQQITSQEMTQAINAIKQQDPNYFEEIIQEVPEVIKNNTNKNIQNNEINNIQNQLDNNAIKNQSNIPTVQDIVNQERTNQDINLPTRDNINQQNNTYQYQTSGNEKIDNLRKSAVENNFNNSESTINYMNMLEQIITDKNVDILFDPNLKDSQGRMANGKYENGVITINPNSNRAGEFIAIHELTHAIGTEQMKNIIQKYRNSNTEFDAAVQQLLKNYNVDEINEEAMADVAGQLFGNQEFINNLSRTQPSLFRKLYNEIKYLWHQFRGYKNQNEFIEDLQYKWEQAYRSNAGLNNTNSYSVETLKNGKSYVKLEDNIFETEDGLPMSQREIYNSLIGKEIVLNDGIKAKIVNRLPSKNMYNELFKRYPTYQNVKDIKTINNRINENFTELLENSDNISPNEPDYNGRHQKQKINSFDTRKVSFFDGNKAYDLDLSIAQLNDGTYIAYAKKNLKPNNNLLNEIKKERSMSKSQLTSAGNNIPQINKNVKSDTSSTKYSIQESQNNTQELDNSSFSIEDKSLTTEQLNNTIDITNEKTGYENVSDNLLGFANQDIDNKRFNEEKYRYTLDLLVSVDGGKTYFNDSIKGMNFKQALERAKRNWGENSLLRVNKENNIPFNEKNNKDNKGRTLSKQQHSFFKDSKVRDESGNLLRVYHGTKNDFTIFDINKSGQSNGLESTAGFWFTENENGAKQFSNEVWYGENENAKAMETYLNIENPKIYQEVDNTNQINNLKQQQKDVSSQLNELYNKYDITFDFVGRMNEGNTFENLSRYINTSESELKSAIKEWTKTDNVDEYYNDLLKYTELNKEQKKIENQLSDLRFTDSYEQFRSDIYKIAGKSPTDANFGGTGMALDNQDEVMSKYINSLKEQGYDGIIIKGTNYDSNRFGENNNQYVAFYPNQIKNVDNLNPTEHEDIRFSKNNETWQDYLEENFESKGTKTNFKDILLPTQKDINKINLPTNKDINLRSLEETAPAVEKNNLGYIPQDPTRESSYDDEGLLNFWELDNKKKNLEDPITEFARATDRSLEENYLSSKKVKENNDLKRQAESLHTVLQEMFVNRNYEIDKFAKQTKNREIMFKGDMLNSVAGETSGEINVAQTDNYGRRIGPSINSLFENAKKKGYYEQFDDYLKHYSNIDRHAYGKGSVVPLEYSQKMVQLYEQSIPGIKNEAEKVWQYGKNILKNLEENGLESKSGKETLESLYPHYVPYRMADSFVPYMDDSGEIKPIQVVKRAKGGADNLITIEEALKRYTYAEKKAIRQNDLFKEIVKSSKEKVSFGADDRIDETDLSNSLFRDNEGNGIVTAYVDGMQQQAKVNDTLYQELTKANELRVKNLESKCALIIKPLQKISEIRRNILTTWNPSFILTNSMKDIQDGMFNSKYTKDMIKNYPGAFIELATQSTETAQQFTSLYGSGMVMGDYKIDSLSKVSKNMDISQLNKIVKILPNANEIVELAPRYAEFKASLQNGCSVTEAMFNARDLTTNFNRGGYITKALNRDGATFLNASVQGFDKLIRNLTGQNGTKGVAVGVAGIMTKVAVLGIAPAMFNAMAFGAGDDDEDKDYKALPDYIKDSYYLFKVKGFGNKTGKYYDGTFLRIPKGRVLSIFGSAARRTLEYSKGDKNAFDGYLKFVDSQIGINNPEENNIIAPIKQAFDSKNGEAWYGGDLVPKRLQNKPVAEQYDEGTDEFSKWLGKMINVSPYKINYLLDQYSGGAGDIVLPMITKETTNGATSVGDYLIAPVKDKFIVNSTDDNKYASKFYTKLETMQIKANGDNVSTSDKLKYKYLSSISSDMSKLYKEKREIQLDDSLSKKEKYKKVQTVQKEINKLAEEGIKEPKIKDVKSHYAKVENTEYYKNSKGSWTTIKDEEASELKSLRMSVNEKSDYFKVKNKIGTIRTSDIESSEKKDKISNLIINMNMSDDKIAYIYGKYYSNEETLDMIQNAGISIKEFIKYNNQSFESEYDSKSNTVKNSKLAKVINYVNTLNLNVAQKAILIKMKYSSYTKYDKQIAEYINSQNLDYLDKATILKKIGFTAYNKQIIKKVNSMDISKEEKLKILKDMGFKVRNGRVYSK